MMKPQKNPEISKKLFASLDVVIAAVDARL
jgi:hypothetical protein